jgi:OOP family OmpA-OmpF porin
MKTTTTRRTQNVHAQQPNHIALAISLVIAGIPSVAFADSAKYDLSSNWYGGANAGQTHEYINDGAIANYDLGGGLTTLTDDRRDNGYKIFGGYQLNDHFSLEAGYFDLGEFGLRATKDQADALKINTKTRGFNLDLVGYTPLTPRLSAFGRAGAHYHESKDRFQGGGREITNPSHERDRDANFKWGGGFQYDVSKNVSVRLEAERYALNDVMGQNGSVNFYSFGALYRFGKVNSSRAQVADEWEEPVAQSAARGSEVYCSKLDIQFEVNNSQIQRQELERLLAVGVFMKKYPDTTAVIEGHTDNVGSAASNKRLSQQRADSVVTYLINNQQIPAARLSAVGYGDARPIADNNSENGKRMNRRINTVIACANDIDGLQPANARITMGLPIEFDNGSAKVDSDYHRELAKAAKFLKENDTVTATVEGHTADLQTTPAQAQEISLQRAQSVVNYLVNDQGVSASRLTAEGFGQSRRYSYNDTAAGRQDNRRVNVVFNYPQ